MTRPSTNVNPAHASPTESAFLLAKTESEGLLQHFGFRETPFGVTPDPEFLFWSEMHRSAFHGIIRSIESNLGFSVLIGAPGTGKTTLLFELLTQYRARARTAFVFQTQCRPNDLLRYIASEFELPCARGDKVLLHQELNAMLIREARAGRKVIIVVDEAQNLQPSALEAVRLLCDFQTPPCKLLHVILAGSSRLSETLLLPDLSQLAQRITTIYRLEPLSELEIKGYVKFRLGVAGAEQPDKLFSSEALAQLAVQSRGVPRLLNAICYRALSRAYRRREQSISSERIKEAASDIDLAESHRNISSDSLEEGDAWLCPISDEQYEAKRHKENAAPDTYISATQSRRTDLPHRFAEAVRVPADHVTKSSEPVEMSARGARPEMHVRVQQRWFHAGPGRVPGVSAFNIASWPRHRSTALIAGLLLVTLSSWVAWNGIHAKPKAHGAPLQQNLPESLSIPTQGSLSPATTEKPATGNVIPDPWSEENVLKAPQTAPEKVQRAPASQHAAPIVDMLSDALVRSRIDTRSLNSAAPVPPSGVESVATASGSTSVPFVHIDPALPLLEPNKAGNGSNGSQVTAPRLVKAIQPDYPAKAKLYQIQGDVLLEIGINENGEVENVRALSGHPILIQAAELAVRQWQYSPSRSGQEPVPAATRVRFQFKLNPEEGK